MSAARRPSVPPRHALGAARRVSLPVFLLLAALAGATPLAGQAPHLLELPASTRAMALGDAFMPDGGSDALFYHPALLLDAGGFAVQLQNWSGEGSAAQASAAGSWFGGEVGVGVGVRTLQYEVAGPDPTLLSGAPDVLFADGGTPVSERAATLGLAREILGVQVGVAGTLIEQRLGGNRDATAAVDLGLATEVGPFTAALSARNLGPEMEFPTGSVSLPRRYTLGLGAYGRDVGPLDVGVTGALTWEEADEELVPAAGLEVGWWPVLGRTFVGRAGIRRVLDGDGNPVSLGFAYWGDDLVLEWAWRPFGGSVDEGTHRFGVGWR